MNPKLAQVNVTSVWLSLRPDWRSEATRKQFSIFTQAHPAPLFLMSEVEVSYERG